MKTDEPLSPSSGRPRGRPRGFDRAEALATALRLFWRHGYEGTSIAALVQAMGITPPALYTAFGSKEALYAEALSLYNAGPGGLTFRALAEAPTACEAVSGILREAAERFADPASPAGCMISLAVLGCAPEHRGVADAVSAMRQQTMAAMADRIRQGRAAGEMPATVDAAALARFYATIIQGMSVQARDGATAAELRAVAEMAISSWPRAD